MKNFILLAALVILPLNVFAGQGKDGGWPQSIQLLRIAKQNLLDLLEQSSDTDVKDALNGKKDRVESIKVEDVDLEMVKRLVKLVESPDVEQIEKSKYDGLRLFFYENSDPEHLRVYATKNFYNKDRYQVNPTDINAAILKEVQTLILHEISHLWGYGEDSEDMNYARTFAVRMVNILHGSLKVNFTQAEKLQSLNKAFFFETLDIFDKRAEKTLDNRDYQCVTINKTEDKTSSLNLKLDPWSHQSYGYRLNGNDNAVLRWTSDNYLVAENSSWTVGQSEMNSLFMKNKGVNNSVIEYTICHTDAAKIKDLTDRMIRPYYTRSNLLTDYDNSSLVVFQSLLMQDINFLGDTFRDMNEMMTRNQNQIIQNIDFKIKVQSKESYDRLTSRKYKYSKDKDTEDMNKLNALINTDLSNNAPAIWSQVASKVQSLNKQIIVMKNPSRQLQMDSYFKNFMKEFNAIADRTQAFEDSSQSHSYACGKEKRLGDYYACEIESSKTIAQARIKLYETMSLDVGSLVKRFTNRAAAIRD